MPSKLISSRDFVSIVPSTPRRASVRRNLSSRKVARPSRYSDPGRANQLPAPPGHRLRSVRSRPPSKIDHRSIVVRTCRIVSCEALVTRHRQAAVDAVRPAGRSRLGRWSGRGRCPFQGRISGAYASEQLYDRKRLLAVPFQLLNATTKTSDS